MARARLGLPLSSSLRRLLRQRLASFAAGSLGEDTTAVPVNSRNPQRSVNLTACYVDLGKRLWQSAAKLVLSTHVAATGWWAGVNSSDSSVSLCCLRNPARDECVALARGSLGW